MSWYFAQWRTAARSGQPPLVWIDDAQHLDGLTASLLRQAVSSNVVQILATHRSSEPLPVEMVAMTTEGSLTTQAVAPLTQKAARHLVNAASTPSRRCVHVACVSRNKQDAFRVGEFECFSHSDIGQGRCIVRLPQEEGNTGSNCETPQIRRPIYSLEVAQTLACSLAPRRLRQPALGLRHDP